MSEERVGHDFWDKMEPLKDQVDQQDLAKLMPLIEVVLYAYYGSFHKMFIERYFKPDVDKFYICQKLVAQVVGNAWIDMNRMAKLHLPADKNPDRHKYAGFVAKWIAKIRPIYSHLLCSDLNIGEALNPTIADQMQIQINAYFALLIYRNFLEVDSPENLDRDLLYTFHFRDERGEMLSILAYTAEKITLLEKQLAALIPPA